MVLIVDIYLKRGLAYNCDGSLCIYREILITAEKKSESFSMLICKDELYCMSDVVATLPNFFSNYIYNKVNDVSKPSAARARRIHHDYNNLYFGSVRACVRVNYKNVK